MGAFKKITALPRAMGRNIKKDITGRSAPKISKKRKFKKINPNISRINRNVFPDL